MTIGKLIMKILGIWLVSLLINTLNAESIDLTKKYKVPSEKKFRTKYLQKYKSSSALVDKHSREIFTNGGNPNYSHIDRSIEFSGYMTESADKKEFLFDKFVISNNSEIISPYKMPMKFQTSCKNNETVFNKYPEEEANKGVIFNYKQYFREEIDSCGKTIFDNIDKSNLTLDKVYSVSPGHMSKYLGEDAAKTFEAMGFYQITKTNNQGYLLNFTFFINAKPAKPEGPNVNIRSVKMLYYLKLIGNEYFIYEGNYSLHNCFYSSYNKKTYEIQCDYVESEIHNTIE